MNRDPIGRRGGKNIYGFVGNSPESIFDVLGLDYRRAYQGKSGCSQRNVRFDTVVMELPPVQYRQFANEVREEEGVSGGHAKPFIGFVPECKCCDGAWHLSLDVSVLCQILLLDDPDLLILPNPGARLTHEKCHCEDFENAVKGWEIAESVAEFAEYDSAETCAKAASRLKLELLITLKLSEMSSAKHQGAKWLKGNRCYCEAVLIK